MKILNDEVVGVKAELIFTGTELLRGQVVNTHGQYLGKKLSSLGIEVTKHTIIGDNSHDLKRQFKNALKEANIIFTTGGLGPTSDDVTKDTFAELLGLRMVLSDEALGMMQEHFKNRGIEMPESLIQQAHIPEGAVVLPNPKGSAPGIMLEKSDCVIFMLPGPPWELQAIFENSVEPYLVSLENKGDIVFSKIIKVTGISETEVQEKLSHLKNCDNPYLSYIAKPGEVHVSISAMASKADDSKNMVNDMAEKVRNSLYGYIFGVDDEVLEEIVGRTLFEKNITISLAESCTGGLISQRVTDISGSSNYFYGGIVAYDNSVKINLLGVSPKILDEYGAVSKETAVAMAEGVCKLTGSSLGLAVTGVAGPSGGTTEKPVGLTYIALASTDGTCCREFRFPGQRAAIRWGASNAGLNMVRLHLLAK